MSTFNWDDCRRNDSSEFFTAILLCNPANRIRLSDNFSKGTKHVRILKISRPCIIIKANIGAKHLDMTRERI